MNEWVPIKGCLYWGYGQMDSVGSILLLLRPWIGYDYTVIQAVCWVELLEQRRLCHIFYENIDLDKWNTIVWYRVTQNPHKFCRLTCFQWDPQIGVSQNSLFFPIGNQSQNLINIWGQNRTACGSPGKCTIT